jgi:hypothetical protein
MQSRKHTFVRNILRVFEVALFFAVSVLGYGLLVKTSSVNAKSRSREHAPGIQRALDLSGLNRELKVLSGTFRFPAETAVTNCSEELSRAFAPAPPAYYDAIPHPDFRAALHDRRHHFGNYPAPPSLPYNLLQQNPVLLV